TSLLRRDDQCRGGRGAGYFRADGTPAVDFCPGVAVSRDPAASWITLIRSEFRILPGRVCRRITLEGLDMAACIKSIYAILEEASDIADAEQRVAFLSRACQGDAVLQREIEELLAAHETAGGFLADPTSARLTLREGDLLGQYKLLQ